MRILITGGMGFQGQHLAKRLLAENYFVTLVVSSKESGKEAAAHFNYEIANGKLSVSAGDVADFSFVASLVEKTDAVFHLAGKISPRESLAIPLEYFKSNVEGTLAVLEAVRVHTKKLIYASSCAVYGDGSLLAEGELFTELHPLLPVDPYAASKVSADRMCYAYAKSYRLDIVILRPFSTYGPGQTEGPLSGLIPNIVGKAARGEGLTVFGDGSAVRDFLYIDDLIDAYLLVLKTPDIAGEVFNVGSAKQTEVQEVVHFVAKKFNVEIVNQAANPNEVKRYAADISKIGQLGYSPNISIEEGINKYINSLV